MNLTNLLGTPYARCSQGCPDSELGLTDSCPCFSSFSPKAFKARVMFETRWNLRPQTCDLSPAHLPHRGRPAPSSTTSTAAITYLSLGSSNTPAAHTPFSRLPVQSLAVEELNAKGTKTSSQSGALGTELPRPRLQFQGF
jgi:hypothetical protein